MFMTYLKKFRCGKRSKVQLKRQTMALETEETQKMQNQVCCLQTQLLFSEKTIEDLYHNSVIFD